QMSHLAGKIVTVHSVNVMVVEHHPGAGRGLPEKAHSAVPAREPHVETKAQQQLYKSKSPRPKPPTRFPVRRHPNQITKCLAVWEFFYKPPLKNALCQGVQSTRFSGIF